MTLASAIHDVTNLLQIYQAKHEEEKPSREEAWEELGTRLESVGKLVAKSTPAQFRKVMLEMATYAIFAAENHQK